jgi:4-diphosphocytidyl-2-C-methyl-D-erythritol kinase
MLVFPNCKINLGLRIIGKRTDGFHNIETIFYPVPIQDVLEILPAKNQENDLIFSVTGAEIEGDPNDNLCSKAYQLLKKDFPQLPPVKIHLHKAIPMGAGLGGGSADGAFTLSLLNDQFGLLLKDDQLANYAIQLGSDCPFFIYNKPCVAKGRGEILEGVTVNLSGYHLVLVNPGIHVNTGWAFSQLNPANTQRENSPLNKSLQSIIAQPIQSWKDELVNDFETPVFATHPVIKEIKEIFYNSGALYASMSGSGSSVFGIFKNAPLYSFSFPEAYLLRSIVL